MRFTVPTGTTIFPRHLNLAFATHAGTVSEVALVYSQTDTFSCGRHGASRRSTGAPITRAIPASRSAYVGPSGGANTEGALVSPRAIYQDIVPAAFAAKATDQYVVDVWWDDLIPIIGPASVLLYFGGVDTTPTGYFSLDWAEVATVNVKEL